ncbi:MAG: hypothetical protein GWO24_22435 [Akkermansiaceae bacterium]|nr:hypothetical protein [Akkermansiaceae bacterium]
MRHGGFDDEIVLTAEGLPGGVTCPPVKVPKGKDHAVLVFQCSGEAPTWQGFVTVKGKAGDTVREARAGAISWSVSDYDRDYAKPRLAKRLALSVCAEEKAAMIVQPERLDYEVDLDGKVEIPFKLVKNFPGKGEFIVSPVGLPYTKAPPQVKLKQDAGEGKLEVTFKKTNEFPVGPGEWQFTLRAEGTIKFRNNLSGLERAEQERKRIEELEQPLLEAAKQARAAVDPASKAVQEAQKNLQSATPEAKAELEAALKARQDELKTLEEAARTAEEKAKLATTEKNAAAERAKQAGERAKERDLKHATHSLPITVVVKSPPPKEEGK